MNRGVYWRTKLIKTISIKKNLIVSIVQSVHINTKVVGSNPVHGDVYLIQHYVIKFVSDLRQVGRWFSPVSSTNKTDSQRSCFPYEA